MDETNLETLGIAPLVDLLTEMAEIFPLDDAAYPSTATVGPGDTKSIGDTLLWLASRGIFTVEEFWVGPDDKDPVSIFRSKCGRKSNSLSEL